MSTIISVIVTAPTASNQLVSCLSSIASQTISSFEIICMLASETPDNVANDLRVPFADQPEKLTIRALQSYEVGQARNEALSTASGDYVLFCADSDCFVPTAFQEILGKAHSTKADLVLFGSSETHAKNGTTRKAKGLLRTDILSGKGPTDPRTIAHHMFQCTAPSPRCKLFKKDLLDSLPFRFESTVRDEDPCFVFTALQTATSIAWIKKTLCIRTVGAPCTPDRTLAESLGLLNSISHWYSHLKGDGSFPELEASYRTAALHEIKREAEAFTYDQTRCQFLDELDRTNFMAIHEVSPEHVAGNPPLRDVASFVEAAIAQRKHERRYVTPPVFEILRDIDAAAPPDVSVIMPVYNAMPYLAETLDSIQQQTLGNIEIICINDGSSDSSLEEILSRAQDDNRIRVVCQQNMGQSRARNIGIGLARGTYLYFMDSDDLISEDALEKLVNRSRGLDLDILCFDADTIYETEELAEQFPSFAHAYERPRWYDSVYYGPELLARLEQDKTYFQSPCLYLTKRSYIEERHITFVEGVLHEDNAFTFACFLGAERVSHLNESLFHRRVREGSTMTSAITFPRPYGYFLCYEHMLKSYYALESQIPSNYQPPLLRIIFQVLSNAQTSYSGMNQSDRGRVLGLGANYKPFSIAVKNPAMKTLRLKETKEALKKEIGRAADCKDETRDSISSRKLNLRKRLRHPKRFIKQMAKRLTSRGE